jgi:isoquinoline 1-oxidoreductase alpha subunit
MAMLTLDVNGQTVALDVDPEMPLLWALREGAGLTGTKYGCGRAQCGACTVHVDGQPIPSCQLPVGEAVGRKIVTIEGVSGKAAEAVRAAWQRLEVPQCGFCQSGQIMAAIGLLATNPKPDDRAINEAMSGNLCRCATYQRIRAAIHAAAKAMEG